MQITEHILDYIIGLFFFFSRQESTMLGVVNAVLPSRLRICLARYDLSDKELPVTV